MEDDEKMKMPSTATPLKKCNGNMDYSENAELFEAHLEKNIHTHQK